MKRQALWLAFILAAQAVSAACSAEVSDAELKVVNGVVIDLDTIPAAIQISAALGGDGHAASCTATWVSATTIITAAHCVENENQKLTNVTVSNGMGSGSRAARVEIHPDYASTMAANAASGARSMSRMDMAVLVFEANVADPEKTAKLSPTPPTVQQAVTIVGYGKFDHADGTSGGAKRKGSNNLHTVDENLHFEGRRRPDAPARSEPGVPMARTADQRSGTGDDVLNSQGDSGGPMLDGDGTTQILLGVSSTVDGSLRDETGELLPESMQETRMDGHYVNLYHPTAMAWLKSLAEGGVQINGISEAKESDGERKSVAGEGGALPPGGGVLKPTPRSAGPMAGGAASPTPVPELDIPVGNGCFCGPKGAQCVLERSGQVLASGALPSDDPQCRTVCEPIFAAYCQ